MRIKYRETWLVGLMTLTFIVLAVGFSLGPVFEGPDEIEHYRYIRTVQHTGGLPPPTGQPYGQFHQAPLYYILALPVATLLPDSDFSQIDGRLNPYHGYQFHAVGNDNKNLYLHTRLERFPYDHSETARSVHILRLISIALGTGTIITCYSIFRILWPRQSHLRLMALGLTAFWPQFVYMSSVINNDNLAFLMAALVLLLVIIQQRDSPTRQRSILLGLALGLAFLTKASLLILAAPVGLATLIDRRFWRFIPLIFIAAAAVAGWWYVRNLILTGDPTGIQAMFQTWPAQVLRSGEVTWSAGFARVPYAYQTLWARFGTGTVAVSPIIYTFFDGLTLISAAGLAFQSIQAKKHRQMIPQIAVLAVFVVMLVWSLISSASIASSGNQGRYLLPGIAVWAAAMAAGLDRWIVERLKPAFAVAVPVVMGAVSAICLIGYFIPAYRVESIPNAIEHPLNIRYGDVAELVGISSNTLGVHPGSTANISLYWRALRSTHENFGVYLHTLDSELIRRDSYPGAGNLLSTDWQAGDTWVENYVIHIPEDAEAQRVDTLVAGLYEPEAQQNIPAYNASGSVITPVVAQIAVHGLSQPAAPDYTLGGVIGLKNPTLKQNNTEIQVCFDWVSMAPTPVSYHVFVHLYSRENQLIAQADSPPRGGRYPTNAWLSGEVISDCVVLLAENLALTGWRVGVGMYHNADQTRLSVKDNQGNELTDSTIWLHPST